MPVFIALLRAVNVGGNAVIPMATLREHLTAEGIKNVRTLLQSGNVVFEAARATPASLEKKLGAAIRKHFGVDSRVIIRTPDELRETVARNPFPKAARDDPSHLLVSFMGETPTPAAVKALAAWKHAIEEHRVIGRDLYINYADGVGTSKFTGAGIDKILAIPGTARNWNTINKLIALAEA